MNTRETDASDAHREIPIRLERNSLFVPASNWHMIEKGATLPTDAICLDLEDSVAPAQKISSRGNVIRAFTELSFGSRLRMFRINGLDTPFAYRDLIEVLEEAGDCIDLIMVPKVESADDLNFVARLLTQIELLQDRKKSIGIEAQIETARGFLFVREISQASSRLEALVFGPGDYAASMQMPSTSVGELYADEPYVGHRWHAVMHTIVAAARASGLRCLDGPFAAYNDAAGFEKSCRIARAMGFDGKQCIHPAQLDTASTIFLPLVEEVEHANRLIEAYKQALAARRGAISLDGKMVDAASVRMAKVVAEKYRLATGN